MNSSPPPRAAASRESVAVTCDGCKAPTTVPFTPTPGRPVYCRACFAKRNATTAASPQGRPAGPARGGNFQRDAYRPPPVQRKRMLAQGRKTHFVYDMKEVLARGGTMDENARRAFIETLFQRGTRVSSEAAHEYLVEVHGKKLLTDEEANRIERLLHTYSFWR